LAVREIAVSERLKLGKYLPLEGGGAQETKQSLRSAGAYKFVD